MIPLAVKLVGLGVVGYLALKKKKPGAATSESGLPKAPVGNSQPVIGQRWTLQNVDLASIVSETNDRWEGFYHSQTGRLVAVVDGNTWDQSHTSAIVVDRKVAPDLPDVWQ